MGAEARPVIRMDENGTYQVELVGRELGGLIGRRGETLDAIQQLTGYAVNHGQSKRVRIHVDAEDYRAKREESLVRLAQQGGRQGREVSPQCHPGAHERL